MKQNCFDLSRFTRFVCLFVCSLTSLSNFSAIRDYAKRYFRPCAKILPFALRDLLRADGVALHRHGTSVLCLNPQDIVVALLLYAER